MRSYIDKIDNKFVERVVGEFLAKEWHVNKCVVKKKGSVWRVVYKINNSYYDFNINNFGADFGKHFWCSTLDLRWRVAMYLYFGEQYYNDLEIFLRDTQKTHDLKAINAEVELEKVKELKKIQERKILYNTGKFL